MKTKLLVSLTIALTLGLSVAARAEDKAPDADMQAMMAKAMEKGKPGAGHEVLKPLEGEWTATSRHWMKPGDKAQESTGTSSFQWILDGRFLKQKFTGNWAGMPFEGIGIVGYDNVKKEYVSLWMDSMSTGIAKASGQYDKGSKTIKDDGRFSCPMTDTELTFRSEWKISGKNQHVYTMFMKDPESGKEFKSMEIVYKRAK